MARPPRKQPPTWLPDGFDTIDPTSLPNHHGDGRVPKNKPSAIITVASSNNTKK